jgi:hypothetical protein
MRRAARPVLLLALGAGVAACTTAQGNSVKDAVNAAGIGPKAVTAPDFIANSRPANADFMPVGVSAPPPAVRPRSADKVRDLEAELAGARGRNAARGGAAQRAGASVKPAAAPKAPPPAE